MLAPNFVGIQLYGIVLVFARIQVHNSSYHTGISSSNALRLLWRIIRGRVTTTHLALTKPSHTTLALPKLSLQPTQALPLPLPKLSLAELWSGRGIR